MGSYQWLGKVGFVIKEENTLCTIVHFVGTEEDASNWANKHGPGFCAHWYLLDDIEYQFRVGATRLEEL